MNEEQAVLDFFAKTENLPLALSVAELVDRIREHNNTSFWRALQQRINKVIESNALQWTTQVTDDKSSDGSLVGLYCQSIAGQTVFLRPMLEQQFSGGHWRIYFGLMWSAEPGPEQLALPAVIALQDALQQLGFKNNSSFLAWQWSRFYPRGKDFQLRFSQHADALLADFESLFSVLLVDHQQPIAAANHALANARGSSPVSLAHLRRNV
ncbi:MAG: hypothetical protein ACOY3V_06460 [Pseudomonadota bacterium]